MVVKEAKRAYTYLSLFGYPTDAVVVNRRLPEDLSDELFRKWRDIHHRYAVEVQQSFQPLPIFEVPLFDEEVVGERMLLRMAETIYGDRDPTDRFYEGSAQRVEKVGSEYVLSLKVPFADREDITLARQDGELFVTVGSYRREVALPRVLAARNTLGAAIEAGELRVRFGK
jgi:arsenite-transporting ATPase